LPVESREMSMRSSTSRVCAAALRAMLATARASRSPSSEVCWRIWAQPTIALSGVRSSCETAARNSSFRRLASRSRTSSASRSISTRRRSSTSSRSASFEACSVALASRSRASIASKAAASSPTSSRGVPEGGSAVSPRTSVRRTAAASSTIGREIDRCSRLASGSASSPAPIIVSRPMAIVSSARPRRSSRPRSSTTWPSSRSPRRMGTTAATRPHPVSGAGTGGHPLAAPVEKSASSRPSAR
jgi:hypothetical protein